LFVVTTGAAPIAYPGYETEQSTLYEAGLLDPDERNELLAFWCEQFEKAQKPDFSICMGPVPVAN
jgi:hypothetical protein